MSPPTARSEPLIKASPLIAPGPAFKLPPTDRLLPRLVSASILVVSVRLDTKVPEPPMLLCDALSPASAFTLPPKIAFCLILVTTLVVSSKVVTSRLPPMPLTSRSPPTVTSEPLMVVLPPDFTPRLPPTFRPAALPVVWSIVVTSLDEVFQLLVLVL